MIKVGRVKEVQLLIIKDMTENTMIEFLQAKNSNKEDRITKDLVQKETIKTRQKEDLINQEVGQKKKKVKIDGKNRHMEGIQVTKIDTAEEIKDTYLSQINCLNSNISMRKVNIKKLQIGTKEILKRIE
jgi:hypothetical protein